MQWGCASAAERIFVAARFHEPDAPSDRAKGRPGHGFSALELSTQNPPHPTADEVSHRTGR